MVTEGRRQAIEQLERQRYQRIVQSHQKKTPVVRNCVKAFLVGGAVCTFGQLIQTMYVNFFGFTESKAGDPTVATLIFISCLLTGFGVYDKIGKWAGAGTGVPVTGFANALASVAIEHKSEGLVLGVGGNMFKLVGSVIVFGVVTAFLIGIVKVLVM